MKNRIFLFLSCLLLKSSLLFAKAGDLTIPEGLLVSSGLEPFFVAKFTFFLALLILWTALVGKVLKMLFNIPVIAGQIISGIFLGPTFFDIKNLSIFSDPFLALDRVTGSLYTIASSDLFIIFILLLSAAFTVPYLLWIAGHETDIKDILKVGFTAVTAGVFGVLFPVFLVAAASFYLFGTFFNITQSIGLGLIFSATSVSIPIAMLLARNKMHLRSSKATLGAAVIDDILAVILLSVFFILIGSCVLVVPGGFDVSSHAHCSGIAHSILYMIFAFGAILTVGYFVIPPVVRLLKHKSQTPLISSVANGVMLLYFAFSELVGGLAGITGAYFAGLFHRMGDKRHAAEKVISPFVNAILLPIFLGSIGLQVDVTLLNGYHWIIVFVLLLVSIISKLLACYAATSLSNMYQRKSNHKWRNVDSYLFGSSMVARGEVGLVISTILIGARVISLQQYVVCVVVIVLTTIMSPIMLSGGFYWLDRIEARKRVKYKDVTVNLGLFGVIGTYQMFNIIVWCLESSEVFKNNTVIFSEGRRIANLEGHNVKIIYSPDEGIILEGNDSKIKKILKLVKNSVLFDLKSVS
ncbi:cation:proton antiporter [Candidatus Dependentiae bacterium]